MNRSTIDALIDQTDDIDEFATALADALDKDGDWDVSDDSKYAPSDRAAVVESTGAYWLVYRGTEPDRIERFGDENAARKALAALEIEVSP